MIAVYDDKARQAFSHSMAEVLEPYTNFIDSVSDFSNALNAVKSSGVALWDTTTSSLEVISEEALRDAEKLGGEAWEVLKKKAREKYLSKRKIKVKDLIGITAASFTFSEFGEILSDRFTEIGANLPRLLKEATKELGGEVASDPELQQTFQTLDSIRATAEVISSVLAMYRTVENLIQKFEPFTPYVDIVVNAALAFWSGGASISKVVSESSQLVIKELQKSIPYLLKPFRDYVLNIELEIYEILLGELQRAHKKSNNPTSEWDKLLKNSRDYKFITDDYYKEISQELASFKSTSLLYAESHTQHTAAATQQALSKFRTKITSSKFIEAIVASEEQGRIIVYRNTHKDEIQNSIISRTPTIGRSTLSIFNHTPRNIINTSRELYNALTNTGLFYIDRNMHRAVVEELKADGALIDVSKKLYDEEGTYKGGEGDRLGFQRTNEKIISYHRIIRALLGEKRADIHETIPVIDFFRKDLTSLLDSYVKTPDGINPQQTRSIISIPPSDKNSPKTTDFVNPNVPSKYEESLINLAVNSYDVAKLFYGSSSTMSSNSNVLVEWGSVDKPRASGLLNGLYTSIKTEGIDVDSPIASSNYVEEWQWHDSVAEDHQERAAALGITLPRGVRYDEAHIVNRGTINPYPLAITGPNPQGYPGLATKIFTELSNIGMAQIGNPHINPSLSDWKTRGGIVECVTNTSHSIRKKVGEQPIYGIRKVNAGWIWPFRWVTKEETYVQRVVDILDQPSPYYFKVNYLAKHEESLSTSWWLEGLSGSTITIPYAITDIDKITPAKNAYNTAKQNYETYGTTYYYRRYQEATANLQMIQEANSPALFKKKLEEQENMTHFYHITINKSTKKIGSITPATPLDIVYNKSVTTSTPPKVVAFIPDALETPNDHYYLSKYMYLVSSYDLGFTTSAPNNLCTFVGKDFVLVMKVASASSLDFTDYSYKFVIGGEAYSSDSNTIINGEKTYIYKLQNVSLTYDSTPIDVYPVMWGNIIKTTEVDAPGDFTSDTLLRIDNLEDFTKRMFSSLVIAGLPPKIFGKFNHPLNRIKKAPRRSLRLVDTFFSSTAQIGKQYLQSTLKNIPIIEKEVEGVARNLPLQKLPDVLEPWIGLKKDFYELKASQVISQELCDKLIYISNHFESIYNNFHSILVSENELSLNQCAILDDDLGNTDNPPWLSVGNDPTDMISEEELMFVAEFLKHALEGVDPAYSYPVRCLPQDQAATGRVDSLYYQRYLFLNNRLHKTTGHLYKAASLLNNWNLMRKSLLQEQFKVNAYSASMEIAPVIADTDLMYIYYNTEGQKGWVTEDGMYQTTIGDALPSGKFISKSILEKVQGSIHDQCLLVCRRCPVKDVCPFYDEDALLLSLMPEQQWLDIYLKDNELDLLAYEAGGSLNLIDADDRVLDAQVIKDRHKQYVEIVRDSKTDKSLEEVRDEIALNHKEFRSRTGEDKDDLGWIQGGRYGTIKNLPTGKTYLYDALFIDDEYSAFTYRETSTYYPVTVTTKDTQYEGSVRIKVPDSLKVFANASDQSDVYLISDDKDGTIIYLNTVGNLRYMFDLQEDSPEDEIMSEDDPRGPRAKDIAQWSVNYYNTFSASPDQWWMQSVTKRIDGFGKQSSVITLPGRKRRSTVVDTLFENEIAPEEVIAGKPAVLIHNDFMRRMSIDLTSVEWVKNGSEQEKEEAKQLLPQMTQNLRLVVVKR